MNFTTRFSIASTFGACLTAAVALCSAFADGDHPTHAESTTLPVTQHNEHEHAATHDHDHAGNDRIGQSHTDEVTLTADAIERYGIKLAAVERHVLVRTISVPARVAFNTEAMAHVGSAVRGRAVEIMVRVGQDVKKGDDLIVVESAELGEAQSDFLQKSTSVAVATAAVEPVARAAQRARKLHEQDQGIALAEVQKRDADVKIAEGAVQTAQAALTAAANKLKLLGMDEPAVAAVAKSSEINPRYVIRAPIDGQVIEREVTLGELVSPEKDAVLVLANVDALWLIASVTESALVDVEVGSKTAARFDSTSGKTVAGAVSFIAPALDPSTRTAQVRIDLPNVARQFRPGMFGTAEIASSRESSGGRVLAVPVDSVQTVEGGPAVFVPVESEANTFAKRAVGVGTAVGGMVPITSGLEEGERVVVAGAFIMKAELGKGGAAHEH